MTTRNIQLAPILPLLLLSSAVVAGLLVLSCLKWQTATAASPDAIGATIVVSTTADELNDNGNCSLREAIQAANTDGAVDACAAGSGDDTIQVPAGTYTLTQGGAGEDGNATGDLDIISNLTLAGSGSGTTTVDGNQLDRVLHIHSGAKAEIIGVDICNGKAPDGVEFGQNGGGLLNEGTVALQESKVCRSQAGDAACGPPYIDCRPDQGCMGGGIFNQGEMVIRSVSVEQNRSGSCGTGGDGGGIANVGAMSVESSTVYGNRAAPGVDWGSPFGATSGGSGGGILNTGTLSITNSTISGNRAGDGGSSAGRCSGNGGSGGGIWNTGKITMNHSTISDNAPGRAGSPSRWPGCSPDEGDGGGIADHSGTVRVKNTILAGNNAAGDSPDCKGTVISFGFNLIGDSAGCVILENSSSDLVNQSAGVAPLADYGGPTATHALYALSPAINSGSCFDIEGKQVATDQRGESRPKEGSCDIGAYEYEASADPFRYGYLPMIQN